MLVIDVCLSKHYQAHTNKQKKGKKNETICWSLTSVSAALSSTHCKKQKKNFTICNVCLRYISQSTLPQKKDISIKKKETFPWWK
jgi:hypothetical protein